MHFSIPDTQVKKNGVSPFVEYNIYINGTFHCSLRYRQLHQFHLQLKKTFGANSLPIFPPKKFLPLTPSQLEERRSQLEKYVQIASQDSEIVNSEIFNNFLLAAQQMAHVDIGLNESFLEIYQLNWQSVKILARCNEGSHKILMRYAQAIHLNSEYLPYFTLYLVRRVENDFKTVRLLENFESPFLTLYNENKKLSSGSTSIENYLILIRKSYWDSAFDEDLFGDKVALNIIYLQALHEVEKGYVEASQPTRNKLTSLQAKGDKIEYLRIARTLKYYSYIHFEPCYCDYPTSKVCVKICAGNQELNISVINSNEKYSFRVIRIKCWRLTTTNNQLNSPPIDENPIPVIKGRFELSFEYLVSKGCLKWITVYSSQAVLISSCLQSMVEEMLLKREGKKHRSDGLSIRYNTNPKYSNINTENGSCLPVNCIVSGTNQNNSIKQEDSLEDINVNKSASYIGKQNIHNVGFEDTKQLNYTSLMENDVFDEIGDEDL